MSEAIKAAIDSFASPVSIFFGSILVLAIFLAFPKQCTSKWVAGTFAVFFLAFFAFGLTDEHFRGIVTKPDNVPIVAMIFIFGYFTWFAMKKAVDNDERLARGEPPWEKTEADEKVLVFPYLIYIEFVVALFCSIGLVLWSIFLKAPLEEPANPTISPNPSKAPWYFLGLQEMLVYFDPWIAGVLFPTFIIIGLCAIPYIDRDTKTSGFY